MYAYEMREGDSFDSLEFTPTKELNDQYRFAGECYSSIYDEIVYPGLLLNMSNNTRSPSFSLPFGWAEIHTKESVDFVGSAIVGKPIMITWDVIDSYEKKGRRYIVVGIMVFQDKELIMTREMTNTFVCGEDAEK